MVTGNNIIHNCKLTAFVVFSFMVVYTGMSVSDISLPKSQPQPPPMGTVNPSGHYSVNTE